MNQDIHTYLTRVAESDITALDTIYNVLSVRIFNYARTIVKTKETAEDVTHDVFMRVYSLSARLAAMENPTAYIMVITRNLAYDHLKRNKFVALDEVYEATTNPYSMLPDALAGLPPNQRETIYLLHICGFTQKEVAKIMGVPLVTVKWRNKKAKQRLIEYFKPEEGGDYSETL